MIPKPAEISGLLPEKELLKSVMVIVPINPKGQTKEQFDVFLQTEYKKAVKVITKATGLSQHPLMPKLLEKLTEVKNTNRHAKSVVVYLSADEAKTYHLKYTLRAKVVLNEKFSIINVVKEDNKYLDNYLAVVLTGCYARIYKASGRVLKKIVVLAQETCDYTANDDMKQRCHLANSAARKKQILARYIKTIDKTLHIFLEAQPLPVFVLGSHSIANYFSENSNYRLNIVEMFTTNYTDINEEFISGLVALWAKHHLKDPGKLSGS